MAEAVLVVEDDRSIAELERDYLEADGFTVAIAPDGFEGLRLAERGEFALVILDLMLPGIDGFNLARKIREFSDVPLIMVTARHEDVDKIRGLGLGVDDYITKPFSPAELVARVKAHLRRYRGLKEQNREDRPSSRAEIRIGGLRLDRAAMRVFVGEREVKLRSKELTLLQLFMENPDWVFTKDEIYDRVWGEERYGDVSTVTVHVRRLREKIEDDPANPNLILTVWGLGYRFSCEPSQP